VVTDRGGPKFIVQHGVTGFIAADEGQMSRHALAIMNDRQMHAAMGAAARAYALTKSWDAVFELVYAAYRRVAS
jgi:hypothetical protein